MDWIQDLLNTPQIATTELDLTDAEWEAMETRSAVRRAISLRREIETFQTKWPAAAKDELAVPTFTWAQLERQLADLAVDPVKGRMARDLVSATRKMSSYKPPEMVLREILCLTWALLDEGFRPEQDLACDQETAA